MHLDGGFGRRGVLYVVLALLRIENRQRRAIACDDYCTSYSVIVRALDGLHAVEAELVRAHGRAGALRERYVVLDRKRFNSRERQNEQPETDMRDRHADHRAGQ